MTTAPVQSLRAAQAVASRGRLARGVSAAGRALAVGGLLSVAAVAASKWFGWELPWWLVLAVPSAVAGSLGFAAGWRRTDRLIASAAKLDEAMGWRDRVSSAIGFGEAKGPFEAIAVSEAESLAASARPERAVEIRFGPPWSFWAGSFAVATAAFAFVPTSIEERGPDARELERREAAADQIDEALRDVQREAQAEELIASEDEGGIDGASEEELAAFDEIQRALAEGEIDADEALGKAAEAVEQKASELEARAEAEQDATDALSEAASRAEPEDERVQELADKLSQGDLAAARDAAREMLDQTDRLTPEERDRLARGLEDLADALDAERAPSEQSQPGAAEGASEREAPPPPTLEEITERLRQEGLKEDAARDAAQKELERQQREEAERQAADDARRLSEALRETADEVREDGASEDASGEEQTGDRSEPDGAEDEGDQGTAPQGEGETPNESQTDSSQATDPSQSQGTSGDQEGTPQGGSESDDASGRSPQDANDPTNPAAREGDPAGGEPNSSDGGSDAAEPAEDVSGGQGAEEATRGDVGEGQRQAADPNEQGTEQGTQQQPGSRPGDQPSSQPADSNQQPSGEQPGGEQPGGEQPGGEQPGGEQPGGEQPGGEQPGGEQPGGEQPGGEQPGGEQPGGEQPEPQQSGGEESGDEQAGGEQSEGGQSPDGAPPENGQPNPDGSGQGTQPSNEPGGDGPGMTPGDAGDSGRDESGESPEGGSSNSDNGKGGSGTGTGDRLNRELDRLAQRQEDGAQDRERARQLRERAEELLDNASPEERARARELAEQFQRFREESGQGFEDDFFDARGESREAPVEGSGQRADLLEDVPGQGGATSSSRLSEQTVREAADGAERAIEQQGVPRRLHRYVRDVYRRFVETAEQTEKGLAPIGPDADSGGSGGDD